MRRYWKTICLFLLAFIPRIYQLGFDVINIDAPFWKENTYNFIGLLFQGKFGDTAITHHPGVTLMWLGGAAMKIFRGVYYLIQGTTASDTHAVYLWTHFAQKLPIALITSGFVVFVYWAVRKLIDESAAFLSAVLLALEPFFLAHSRVFHLDALLTVFMCSSVLFLLLYLRERDKKLLVASGILGGLALLTKSTALFLIPFAALVVFLGWFSKRSKPRYYFLVIGVWLLVVTATFVAVWPSMWAQPLNTLKLYFSGITTEATAVDPHITNPAHFAVSGHTIFGQLTYNPDWYYYPVVLALRLSPISLLFGVVGVMWAVSDFLKERKASPPSFLILYSLFFLATLSLPAKKLDRYILPTLPFFCILAAWAVSRLVMLFSYGRTRITSLLLIVVLLIVSMRFLTFKNLHPDYGLYFSPLFGGIRTGLKFDSDYWWGEGYKKAADYLNSKPGAENHIVGVLDDRSFKPFFNGITHDLGAEYDESEDYWIRSPRKQYEGFELEQVIRVGGYPLWGIFRKVEK